MSTHRRLRESRPEANATERDNSRSTKEKSKRKDSESSNQGRMKPTGADQADSEQLKGLKEEIVGRTMNEGKKGNNH